MHLDSTASGDSMNDIFGTAALWCRHLFTFPEVDIVGRCVIVSPGCSCRTVEAEVTYEFVLYDTRRWALLDAAQSEAESKSRSPELQLNALPDVPWSAFRS